MITKLRETYQNAEIDGIIRAVNLLIEAENTRSERAAKMRGARKKK